MAITRAGARSSRRWTHLTLAAIMLLALTALFTTPARADGGQIADGPGGDLQNPVILNAQIARPAVVRILVTYDVELDVPLCNGLIGRYGTSSGGSGSGAFISSSGDILTAGHVVSDPVDDVASLAPQVVADVQKHCHQTITVDDVVSAYELNPSNFTLTYTNQVNSVYLSTAYVGSYESTSIVNVTAYPFTLVGMSSELKNDVAVIHVNLTDTPSVPIGDSSAVSPTDTLTELGFPGNGDLAPLSDLQDQTANNFFTDSVNFITVSAIKTNPSGGTLIEVGGNVEHGDSGGPCLNAAGQEIGVVSFSESDTGGTHFLQATSSAQPYLKGIDTTPGKFQTLWRQALTTYASTASGHWHQAVPLLQQLAQSYPQFGGVKPYLTYAQHKEATEQINGSQTNNQVLEWLQQPANRGLDLGGLAGLALLVLIFALIGGSRRRAAAERAAAHAAVPVAVPVAVPAGIPYEAMPPAGQMPLPSLPSTPLPQQQQQPAYPQQQPTYTQQPPQQTPPSGS